MIKATIAGESFVLPTLKDAELLLQILERASPVKSRHIGPDYREVLYTPDFRPECSIAICSGGQILSFEEYQTLCAAEEQRRAAIATDARVPA